MAIEDPHKKPDTPRARESLTPQVLGKNIQETADILCVSRSAIDQQNNKWTVYYCGVGVRGSMQVAIVCAIDDGTRRGLIREFKNNKLLGPVIREWREKKEKK